MSQTLMGMVASCCFALLFGIRDRKLLFIPLGSGAGWGVYLLLTPRLPGIYGAIFFASLFVALMAEIYARLLKTPVLVTLVPMLVPEIPGGDLYYTMYYFVMQEEKLLSEYSKKVIFEAACIALGIILAAWLAKFASSVWRFFLTAEGSGEAREDRRHT